MSKPSGPGYLKGRPVEMFSETRIELMKEINKHEDLCKRIYNAGTEVADYETVLAMAAAYCQIAVDGWYKPEEVEVLERMLMYHLKNIRGSDIIIN